MYNKYFENISTLEELRKQYKELLKLHHPDNGGNLEIMQEINAEYDRLFKILKISMKIIMLILITQIQNTII